MAADPAEDLTQQHRVAQVAIAAQVVQRLLPLWRLLNPRRIDITSGDWVEATVPVIGEHYARSQRLALEYLRTLRTLDLGIAAGRFTPELPEVDETALRASLLVTGPIGIKQRTRRLVLGGDGDSVDQAIDRAASQALTEVAGAAMRHTLAGGRDLIATAVQDDRQALGYVRRSTGRPCYFCAMLISRGPVYKGGSFAESDPRFTGPGEFKVHDHDGCTLRPVYSEAVQLDDVDQYAALWQEHAAHLSGRDAINAFRHAYDAQSATLAAEPAAA